MMNAEDYEKPLKRVAMDCSEYFQKCLARFNSPGEPDLQEPRLVVEEYQRRFNAWALYLGVFAGTTSCLDHRLRNHSTLQDMIIRLLEILRRNVFLGMSACCGVAC